MLDQIHQQQENDLAALAVAIRKHVDAINAASLTALDHALDAGDALIAAQAQVTTNWRKWLQANCLPGVSTALLYQQLARHREEIEAEASRFPGLSLNAARRLITKPKSKPTVEKAKKSPALNPASFMDASPEERLRFLSAIGLTAFLAAMPSTWRSELDRRMQGQRSAATSPLGDKVTKALRAALSHGKLKTDHDKASALASLHGINNLLAAQELDLHDIEITVKPKVKFRRPRAA